MDVAGIEPATPCLQRIGLDSIRSIHYCQLPTFPTNRGICFSLKASSNVLKAIDSYTIGAQWISGEISETEPLAETKVCITPCFRAGLLFQCHVLSAEERHYRRWHSTPTLQFTSQLPRLGFQQSP